jgi:hypothetical protein
MGVIVDSIKLNLRKLDAISIKQDLVLCLFIELLLYDCPVSIEKCSTFNEMKFLDRDALKTLDWIKHKLLDFEVGQV